MPEMTGKVNPVRRLYAEGLSNGVNVNTLEARGEKGGAIAPPFR